MRQVRWPNAPLPLRLSPRAFWLGGGALALLGILAVLSAPFHDYVDFPQFWAAGRTVGTPDLFDGARHQAWQLAHDVPPSWWMYPPGSAWLFVPFSVWSVPLGFWLHALVMAGCVVACGWLGGRVFGLDRRVALLLAFAWTPSMSSAISGQNAALALLLCLVAIEGLRRGNDGLAGLAIGLLLYKPSLALPLLALLALRLRWRALPPLAVCAAAWYLAGVAAAAGEWSWPGHWLSSLGDYYPGDTAFNVVRAISTPGVVQGLGAPGWLALALGAAIGLAAVPRLVRAPIVEAGAGALAVGLAVSPHALNYEGALVLPILLWALGGSGSGIREPARTRLVVGACLIAPGYLVAEAVGLSILAPLVLAAALIWIFGWWRFDGRAPAAAAARAAGAAPTIPATAAPGARP
jgi:hypothetical protein